MPGLKLLHVIGNSLGCKKISSKLCFRRTACKMCLHKTSTNRTYPIVFRFKWFYDENIFCGRFTFHVDVKNSLSSEITSLENRWNWRRKAHIFYRNMANDFLQNSALKTVVTNSATVIFLKLRWSRHKTRISIEVQLNRCWRHDSNILH